MAKAELEKNFEQVKKQDNFHAVQLVNLEETESDEEKNDKDTIEEQSATVSMDLVRIFPVPSSP